MSNKTQNTRVNSLESRLRQLEGIKEATDSRIDEVMGLIDRIVDRLAASLKQLQSQLNEQKQVTDWVRREYRLRPVKKVG